MIPFRWLTSQSIGIVASGDEELARMVGPDAQQLDEPRRRLTDKLRYPLLEHDSLTVEFRVASGD